MTAQRRLDGSEVRRRREALGLTQSQANARAGFTRKMEWSDVERNVRTNPRLALAVAVASALGCRVDDLLTQ
jgi:transcriptional regulator with XRE-family HTH domain